MAKKVNPQQSLPGQEDIPPPLREALHAYAQAIGAMRSVMRRNDEVDVIETQKTIDELDRRAIGIVDVLAELSASHGKAPWWITMFGKGKWRKPGHVSKKRGVAARLFLLVRDEVGIDASIDPSPYHRPISELDLHDADEKEEETGS